MNIKRVISAALVFCTLLSLCACQPAGTGSSVASEEDLPELKIGVDILKPFYYIDENGNCAGIDAEIAAEACRRAGYRPTFVQVSWSDRDDKLQAGTVDCLWNAFIKNGRESDYQWTDPYMQSNLRAIVDNQSPDQSLSSIRGRGGMAVRTGSRLEDLLLNELEALPSLQIYSCETFDMAETAFVKGYASSLGGHEVVLQQVVDSYPGLYRFLDGTIMTADLAVAFSKDDATGRCQQINDAIDEMKNDGTLAKILSAYSSDSDAEEGSSHD